MNTLETVWLLALGGESIQKKKALLVFQVIKVVPVQEPVQAWLLVHLKLLGSTAVWKPNRSFFPHATGVSIKKPVQLLMCVLTSASLSRESWGQLQRSVKAKLLLGQVVLPCTQGISFYGCLTSLSEKWSSQFGPEHRIHVIFELFKSPNGRLRPSISSEQGAEAPAITAKCLQRGLMPVFLTSKAPSVALYKVFN